MVKCNIQHDDDTSHFCTVVVKRVDLMGSHHQGNIFFFFVFLYNIMNVS